MRELRALFTIGGWVGLKHPTLVVVEALQELIDITGQLMFLEGGRDDNLPQLQGTASEEDKASFHMDGGGS